MNDRLSADLLKPGNNSDAQSLRERAAALIDLGRDRDALPLLHQALAREPDSGYAMALLSAAYHRLDQTKEALQWVERAIAADPEYAWAHYLRGHLLAKTGNERKAREAAEEAVRLAPNNLDFQENLVVLLIQAGKLRDAQHIVENMLALDPNSATSHIATARLMLARKDTDEAEGHAQLAVSLEPSSAVALAMLGVAVMGQHKRQQEGLDLIHRAVKLDPSNKVATAALEGGLQDFLPKVSWWEWLIMFANPLSFVINGTSVLWRTWRRYTRMNALPSELKTFAKRRPKRSPFWLKFLVAFGLITGISGIIQTLISPWDHPIASVVALVLHGGITGLSVWGIMKLRKP